MTIGLNISGGEFGGTTGVHDQQYHYPTFSELQFYKNKGVDLIRLPFRWERMQDTLGGPLDTNGDLAMLKRVLVDAALLGMDVIIDNHNYGRYNGIALGAVGGPTPAQFADFWKKMAIELKDYPALAGYDLMNEPHDMPTTTIWKESAQAATNAIRTVDSSNTIIIEGDHWSGARNWASNSNANLIINDPANNIVYQAHQYLDRNSSGVYSGSYDTEGAYANVGVDRLKPFVEWLNANGLKGMIGEFGVPSNDVRWIEAQKNMLDYMKANNLDGTAWAGGAWWPSSYELYTAAPGREDSAFGNLLEQYYDQFDGFGGGTVTSPPPPPPVGTVIAPSVAINDVTVDEAAGSVQFTVTRSGSLTASSTVNYTTANGTAVAGLDYAAVTGSISFAAGETRKTITVAVINDTLVEGSETLTVNLSGGTNVTISDAQGAGTIVSDDVAVVATAPTSVAGAITGTDGNETINSTQNLDTIYALGGNDTINGSGGADIIDGGAGNDTISYHWSGAAVNVDLLRATQQNGDAHGDRLLRIENIIGSAHNDFLHGNDGANIINGRGGLDVMSGRGGADKFVFNSARDANGDLITDYSSADTLDFSAFNPKFLSLTNDGNQTRIVGDTNGDGLGDFSVVLNGVHTSVNGVSVGAVVLPPPPPPVVVIAAPSVAINDVTVDEVAGTMQFTVTRSGSLTASSTVNYTTANGTAAAGSDYGAGTGSITFAAGETSKTITIAILDDKLIEVPETMLVNLTGGTNVTISDGQGVGTIMSDDVAAPPPPPATPIAGLTIKGKNGADTINGGAGDDVIFGLNGTDVINGGGGADTLTGGRHNDRFVFDTAPNANGDHVTDLETGDILDFRSMDANSSLAGDQAFTWLDTGQFTGSAGQLREYDYNGAHYIAGDINGDGVADFTIEISGYVNLQASDLYL